MRILVGAFVEDQPLGERWGRHGLPDLVALVDPVDVDAEFGQVEAVVEVALSAYGPLVATAGDDVAVGAPEHDVAVQLEDDGTLAEVHRDLLRGLRPLLTGGVGHRWRAEIPIRDDDRLERGDEIEFDAVAVLVLDEDADEWELAAQFPLI